MDWIKVTPETMPKNGQHVIATIFRIDGKKDVEPFVRHYNGQWEIIEYDSIYWQPIRLDGTDRYLEVTHWMPYPDPAED